MNKLIQGYRRFRKERWPQDQELFHQLADGQAPKTLVIACSDSRVDPATIFSAAPGELFVIRNVANVVPPVSLGAGLHGTAAAIEYAVTALNVETVLVLGHAACGGVAAAMDKSLAENLVFVEDWVVLLDQAVDRCAHVTEDRHRAVEREGIRLSLDRLAEYSFIQERLADGRLKLQGARFDIGSGTVEWLNHDTNEFEVLE